MSEQPFPLEQQICFTLYRTNMAINRAYKPMLDAMGITYPQYLVLNVLGEEDGRTIGAIAGRLSLESSTVTPAVKRMEAAGLLTRKRGAVDERQVQVWLTDEGRALLSESACLGGTLLRICGLSPEGLQALNRQVQALNAALSANAGPAEEKDATVPEREDA